MLRKFKYILKNRFFRNIQENDIKYTEAKNLMKNGAILVDVRTPLEYKEGHLDNAILIPDYDLSKKAEKILKDKNKNIILYCATGNRSKKSCELLKKQGYQHVYNLYGGLEQI